MSDLWTAAKTVTALEAAERYAGIQGRRYGSKVKCCCPLHDERTPSCTFFPDGHFHCFGCHAGGTSIDFVMKLFSLSNVEAARKICADYGIVYDGDQQLTVTSKPKQLRRADAKEAVSTGYRIACDYLHMVEWLIEQTQPKNQDDDPPEVFYKSLRQRENITGVCEKLFDLIGREEWNEALSTLEPIAPALPKWEKAHREWLKQLDYEKQKGGQRHAV